MTEEYDPNKMKNRPPEKDANQMMSQVADSFMLWPRKPLGKPVGKAPRQSKSRGPRGGYPKGRKWSDKSLTDF
jgi:hypothetical protein